MNGTTGFRVIRRAAFTATPWKNGGGITHEAVREPAGGDGFRWRVSIAHIDAAGPFSHFPDHHRTMVLLQGGGIELRFAGDGIGGIGGIGGVSGVAGGGVKTLREVGDLIEFDGALTAHCELLHGPCVDLNLMVSKAERVANATAARVERFVEPLTVGAARHETLLIFPVDGAVELALDSEEPVTLEPWDLALLSQMRGRLQARGRLQPFAPAATAVFLATLKFVGGQ